MTSCENSLDLRDNKLRLLILQSLLIIGSKYGISRQQGYSLILHGEATSCSFTEGREGVKWELGFAFFRGWEMGFCALGLGFMKQKQWDFNLSNTGWDCGI